MSEGGQVRRLHPDFAVESVGLDLRGGRSARAIRLLDDGLRRERLVVIRGQHLSTTAQLRLASSLGTLHGQEASRHGPWCVPDVRYESTGTAATASRGTGTRTAPQVFYNEQWHADLSWAPRGSAVTLLYAIAVDPGCAPTSWTDMVGA